MCQQCFSLHPPEGRLNHFKPTTAKGVSSIWVWLDAKDGHRRAGRSHQGRKLANVGTTVHNLIVIGNLQVAGEASVAIRAGLGAWPGLGADFLMPVRYTPMLSPAFVARHGLPAAPAALRDLPLVDPDDPGWAQWFAAAGVTAPNPVQGTRSNLGTQLLAAQAVIAGQGAGLLTPVYFRDQLARGELIQPFDILAADAISIWLVYPERRRNAPAIRAFRVWLLAEMRTLGEGDDPAADVRSSSS